MLLRAPAPRANERIVQSASDSGTSQRDQTSGPLFSGFSAHLGRQSTGNARRDAFEDLLFGQVLAEVDSRSGSCGFPHLNALVHIMNTQSVKQAEPLNK